MQSLFGGEWERAAKWMEAASSEEPPVEPLHMRREAGDDGEREVPRSTPGATPSRPPPGKNEPTLASPTDASASETKPEGKKKAEPSASKASTRPKKQPAEPAPNPLRDEPTPTWQYVAAVAVIGVAVAMAIYASRF
jgi:hypothetical protein